MSKGASPDWTGEARVLNRQRLEGAADVGHKRDVRERDFQCPGDGVQQSGVLVGHPAGFERLPLRRLDPAQLGGAFDQKGRVLPGGGGYSGRTAGQDRRLGGGGQGRVLRYEA